MSAYQDNAPTARSGAKKTNLPQVIVNDDYDYQESSRPGKRTAPDEGCDKLAGRPRGPRKSRKLYHIPQVDSPEHQYTSVFLNNGRHSPRAMISRGTDAGVDTMEQRLRKAEAEVKEANTKLAELTQDLSVSKKETLDLRKRLGNTTSACKNKVDAAEKTQAGLTQDLSVSKEILDLQERLEKTTSECKNKVNAAEKKQAELTQDLSTCKKETLNLQERLEKTTSECKNKVDAAERKQAKLTQDLSTCKKETLNLQAKLTRTTREWKDKVDTTEKKQAELTQDLSACKKEILNLRAKLTATNSESKKAIDEATEKRRDLSSQLTEKDKQLQEKQYSCEVLESTLATRSVREVEMGDAGQRDPQAQAIINQFLEETWNPAFRQFAYDQLQIRRRLEMKLSRAERESTRYAQQYQNMQLTVMKLLKEPKAETSASTASLSKETEKSPDQNQQPITPKAKPPMLRGPKSMINHASVKPGAASGINKSKAKGPLPAAKAATRTSAAVADPSSKAKSSHPAAKAVARTLAAAADPSGERTAASVKAARFLDSLIIKWPKPSKDGDATGREGKKDSTSLNGFSEMLAALPAKEAPRESPKESPKESRQLPLERNQHVWSQPLPQIPHHRPGGEEDEEEL